jgi:hypothetical protein
MACVTDATIASRNKTFWWLLLPLAHHQPPQKWTSSGIFIFSAHLPGLLTAQPLHFQTFEPIENSRIKFPSPRPSVFHL